MTKGSKNNGNYGLEFFTAHILPEGFAEITQIGEYLREVDIDYSVCSPFRRCKETARMLAKGKAMRFRADRRLEDHYMQPHFALERRVHAFLDDPTMKEFHNVCIVTHGAVILEILRQRLHEPQLRAEHVYNLNGTGCLYVIKGDQLDHLWSPSIQPQTYSF